MTIATKNSAPKAAIAEHFVQARLAGSVVHEYPGDVPQNLGQAYAIQDHAIALWPTPIVGWKVGGISGDWAEKLDTNRLVGPVFTEHLWHYSGTEIDVPVFGKGFAAFEGEITAILGADVPDGKSEFTTQDALDLIASLHFGVEIASSPFPEINEHGPLVTISDFGNNKGLILGDEIPDWRDLSLEDWVFETVINGQSVGKNPPTGMPGGPVESVRYALQNIAQRGHELTAGTLILTGAVTGVHQGFVGDHASLSCAGTSPIHCALVEQPHAE